VAERLREEHAEAEVRPQRKRAPRGQGERLREEILEAAERLLVETGDEEAVSIRAVAEAVGVTPPSIYLHFADKTELIYAVCEKNFAEFDRFIEEVAGDVADSLGALRRLGRAYVQFGLDRPEQYRILFMTPPPEGWSADRILENAAFGHLLGAVQAGLEAGVLAPANPVLISLGLWAAVHGVTSLLITKPEFPWPDVDQLVDHVVLMCVDGLATPSAKARGRVAP
jgi:AcrR family transcriptional regulator